MKILLIEDDALLLGGLQKALEQQQYCCDVATSIKTAQQHTLDDYELIILDLGLPDGDGLTLLKQWRQQGCKLPVLILTARDSLDERVKGLDQGADDYLIKPYEFDELLARINALLRRGHAETAQLKNQSQLLKNGDLVLDVEQHLATFKGQQIELSNREWAILIPLVSHPNKIFSKANLEDKLYDFDSEVTSNTIEVYVHHLRAKLGKDFIRTIRGLGYRLGQS